METATSMCLLQTENGNDKPPFSLCTMINVCQRCPSTYSRHTVVLNAFNEKLLGPMETLQLLAYCLQPIRRGDMQKSGCCWAPEKTNSGGADVKTI